MAKAVFKAAIQALPEENQTTTATIEITTI